MSCYHFVVLSTLKLASNSGCLWLKPAWCSLYRVVHCGLIVAVGRRAGIGKLGLVSWDERHDVYIGTFPFMMMNKLPVLLDAGAVELNPANPEYKPAKMRTGCAQQASVWR